MLKNKQIEVNSTILYQLSQKLLQNYSIEPNLYSLLLLSYITIYEYSRIYNKLDKQAKIDLCLQYTPDLITGLGQSKIIDMTLSFNLKKQLDNIDLKSVFEVYHYLFTLKYNKHKTSFISCISTI